MAIDLHLHSSASDGTDSPADIAHAAHALGLTAIALTDHDTLSGIGEALPAAAGVGLRVVPGVELSVDHQGLKMHMLVYFLEPGNGPLQDRLGELRTGRTERNRAILDKLKEHGISLDEAEVLAQAGGESVGRPHIADALVARGIVTTRVEAFEQYLGDGGVAYVHRRRLVSEEAITLAAASGAVTSLAHPYTIDATAATFPALFTELKSLGLTGLEAYYPEHPPELRRHLVALAGALELVATGGSDYHGLGKPGLRPGVGYGDLEVPDSVLDDLEERRP